MPALNKVGVAWIKYFCESKSYVSFTLSKLFPTRSHTVAAQGEACSENIKEINNPGDKIEECDNSELNLDIEMNNNYLNKKGDLNVADVRLEMQKPMQKHAGVFRNDKLLEEGVTKICTLHSYL